MSILSIESASMQNDDLDVWFEMRCLDIYSKWLLIICPKFILHKISALIVILNCINEIREFVCVLKVVTVAGKLFVLKRPTLSW